MARVFSGIQPSGDLHLGNYLGALRHFVEDQHRHQCLFCVVDLHALTVPQEPGTLAGRTLDAVLMHLAVGLDPAACTLFVQSHVSEHAELAWLMACTASVGELRRMTQFKEKSESQELVSAGLFAYPTLMAADILLYDTDRVPVGDDQRQHLELARDLAVRFNHRFGTTFVVPEAAIPGLGARIMDLQRPTQKMSKSSESPQGTIRLLDDPATVERKIRRAVTDPGTEVRYDPEAKPGVSNLLAILAATTGADPLSVAARYDRYGPLKADCARAVVELLGPVQARYAELAADPAAVAQVLAGGAERARSVAGPTLARAWDAVGVLPRGRPGAADGRGGRG
ncbi:MAG: tryptophan--tRNA ligase [Acidimicrobiales bacterium]